MIYINDHQVVPTIFPDNTSQIFKNPKTDDGTKKSQKGAVAVFQDGNSLRYEDELTLEEVGKAKGNLLTTIFEDGLLYNETTLTEIRKRLNG